MPPFFLQQVRRYVQLRYEQIRNTEYRYRDRERGKHVRCMSVSSTTTYVTHVLLAFRRSLRRRMYAIYLRPSLRAITFRFLPRIPSL